MTIKTFSQSEIHPESGYYLADATQLNLKKLDGFDFQGRSYTYSYSYLDAAEEVLTTYKFPEIQIDSLDFKNKEFKTAFFTRKPKLIWKDKNSFNISIQDTIFEDPVYVYATLIRVEENDERILKIKDYLQQKQQEKGLANRLLEKEFLTPLSFSKNYVTYIPKTTFGISKPLDVSKETLLDANFSARLKRQDKDSLVFYGTYKYEKNTNYFNGLHLAIMESSKGITLDGFLKKINLKTENVIFKTDATVLIKTTFDEYIFFSVKKLNQNTFAISKGVSNTFEFSKKQFHLFSSIDKLENIDALPIKTLFTNLPLMSVDSIFTQSVNKELKNKFKPYQFISKTHRRKNVNFGKNFSLEKPYLELKKEAISKLISDLKVKNKAFDLMHQDKNSLIFIDKKTARYNIIVLRSYKNGTVMLSLNQIDAFFSVSKPLQYALHFYNSAKKVKLDANAISKKIILYLNYFKSASTVFNKKDNMFIVTTNDKKEGVLSIKGDYILKPKYNDISYASEGKGFYIETFDRQIIKPKPEETIQYDRIVEKNKKRGWASEDGKFIIEPQYHSVGKVSSTNLLHVYSEDDEEGIMNVITKKYVIPLKKHNIRHYDREQRFKISEGYGKSFLANYEGDLKGPFDSINYKKTKNIGEFIGVKDGNETKLLFE